MKVKVLAFADTGRNMFALLLCLVMISSAENVLAEDATGADTATVLTEQAASDQTTTAESSMQKWVAELGETGTFEKPRPAMVQRQAFGKEAGLDKRMQPQELLSADRTLVNVCWAVTGLCLIGTIVCGLMLSKLQNQAGETQRALTLGVKLSASFGGLATLIMLVSTLSISTQSTLNESIYAAGDIVEDAGLIDQLERNMLMVRMNVKDFLITNSQHDLDQYTPTTWPRRWRVLKRQRPTSVIQNGRRWSRRSARCLMSTVTASVRLSR